MRPPRYEILIIGGLLLLVALLVLTPKGCNAPKSPPNVATASERTNHAALVREWLDLTVALQRWGAFSMETNSFAASGNALRADNLTASLLNKGPNITPAIVETFRSCTNSYHLTNIVLLLGIVARIDLRYERDRNSVFALDAMHKIDQRRALFLKEWDADSFKNPNKELFFTTFTQARLGSRIHPEDFSDIIVFGIFGLPPTIEFLARSNSPSAFAFFITQAGLSHDSKYWLYYSNMYTGHEDKLLKIREWWRLSQSKYNELHPLYERIDAAVKALQQVRSLATNERIDAHKAVSH